MTAPSQRHALERESTVSSVALSVEPVSGFIGAEVDLDLSRPFDEQTRKALNDALDDHLVLFFRDQKLDPISLKRLEARPIATMTLEAQEAHERMERIYRDE